MKKKLNTESIANELEGASLFFTKSPTPPSLPKPEKSIIDKYTQSTANSPLLAKSEIQESSEQKQDKKRSNERTPERTNEPTNKPIREKIRHTFDIYKDQLMALQIIQLEAVQKGKKKPKLGKMVSKGIDLFLKQESSRKK